MKPDIPDPQHPRPQRPEEANRFLSDHVQILLASYRHWTGEELIASADPKECAFRLYTAPFAVVSHGIEPDPIFNYANRKAQELFELPWERFIELPSRKSAEPVNRKRREELLARVTRDGYVDDYEGVRISATGRRFHIHNATVWNLLNSEGINCGQAATFSRWEWL
jgi:hypothetical protein